MYSNRLANYFLLQNFDGWFIFSLGRYLICVAREHFQLSTTKDDISNTLWEWSSKVSALFKKAFQLYFDVAEKVLHASSHPLFWQLHLMSAKWSEKHPLLWVASWWQGRGDAVIGAVKSRTHLPRQNSCLLVCARHFSAWLQSPVRPTNFSWPEQ